MNGPAMSVLMFPPSLCRCDSCVYCASVLFGNVAGLNLP